MQTTSDRPLAAVTGGVGEDFLAGNQGKDK
jgi:hypothetical protein